VTCAMGSQAAGHEGLSEQYWRWKPGYHRSLDEKTPEELPTEPRSAKVDRFPNHARKNGTSEGPGRFLYGTRL